MAVLALEDIKTHLNITSADNDGELQSMLAAAVAAIGERVGPLEPATRTVRVSAAGRSVLLPGPVVSVTSIVDADGNAVAVPDTYLDVAPGLVTMNDGTAFASRFYTVTYVAGRDPVPQDLQLAVKELVRHFWLTQRGPTRRPGGATSEAAANTVPGAAHMLPFRVAELIKPYVPIMVSA